MTTNSLLVAGAGSLGLRVANLWKYAADNKDSILCETRSLTKQKLICRLGFKHEIALSSDQSTERLLICIPPHINICDQLELYFKRWNRIGPAVYISSTGVYSDVIEGWVDENSPVNLASQLYEAEEVAKSHGSHILRLAGLYDCKRGPHIFWQKQGSSPLNPNGIVNLIHRQDAASAIFKVLNSSIRNNIWNISDGAPITRKEIADQWAQSLNRESCRFLSTDSSSKLKKISHDKFSKEFEWSPRWKNFSEFVQFRSKHNSKL